MPTLAHAIVNYPQSGQLELGCKIKLLNIGGGSMPLSLIEQVEDLGIIYSEKGWGMIETTSLDIANPFVGLEKYGSIGIPLVRADVKLVALESGQKEVPAGSSGEIVIKAPYVMSGYCWHNPEERRPSSSRMAGSTPATWPLRTRTATSPSSTASKT